MRAGEVLHVPDYSHYAVWMTEERGQCGDGETNGETSSSEAADVALIAEQVTDLARVLARQAQSLERLADADRQRAAAASAGADVSLLVDLHALYIDAATCVATAATEADRTAFAALRDSLERIILGRGGAIVAPGVGAEFDARSMEAIETRAGDSASDRTIAEVVRPGLRVGDRVARPALVVVYRGGPTSAG